MSPLTKKWILFGLVLVALLLCAAAETAEAARVRVYYPGYQATYVYRPARVAVYPVPYAPVYAPYYWSPPVTVYRPAPVVAVPAYPVYPYAPAAPYPCWP